MLLDEAMAERDTPPLVRRHTGGVGHRECAAPAGHAELVPAKTLFKSHGYSRQTFDLVLVEKLSIRRLLVDSCAGLAREDGEAFVDVTPQMATLPCKFQGKGAARSGYEFENSFDNPESAKNFEKPFRYPPNVAP